MKTQKRPITPQQPLNIDRQSPAFLAGQAAAANGQSVDTCPEVESQKKLAWYSGWYETDIGTRLKPEFDRLGVSWEEGTVNQ